MPKANEVANETYAVGPKLAQFRRPGCEQTEDKPSAAPPLVGPGWRGSMHLHFHGWGPPRYFRGQAALRAIGTIPNSRRRD